MAMGTRESEQSSLWIATSELPKSPGHPFYARLNALLDAHDFDRFVEGVCRGGYRGSRINSTRNPQTESRLGTSLYPLPRSGLVQCCLSSRQAPPAGMQRRSNAAGLSSR